MSQDLHPNDGNPPVSGGGFYLRLLFAVAVIVGGLVLVVWYTNR